MEQLLQVRILINTVKKKLSDIDKLTSALSIISFRVDISGLDPQFPADH